MEHSLASLLARVQRLEAALEPFSDYAVGIAKNRSDLSPVASNSAGTLWAKDFRAAREARLDVR